MVWQPGSSNHEIGLGNPVQPATILVHPILCQPHHRSSCCSASLLWVSRACLLVNMRFLVSHITGADVAHPLFFEWVEPAVLVNMLYPLSQSTGVPVMHPLIFEWVEPAVLVNMLCLISCSSRVPVARPLFFEWVDCPVNMPDLIQISSKVLARSGSDDSCTLACFWTGSIWPALDTVSQNQTGSRPVLHSMIRAICGRMPPSLRVGN